MRARHRGSTGRPASWQRRCSDINGVPSFAILTTTDLPEAYFLAHFLEARGERFAMVNVAARGLRNQLAVLARLRRNRGNAYLADLLLARAAELMRPPPHRRDGVRRLTAFPEIDVEFIRHARRDHPHLECRDPHDGKVLDFLRSFGPDYLLLAGAPILKPAVFGLAREATLNRHLGLVPEFRGSDCMLWALALDRPESVGFSIHVVSERVDAGDLVVRRPVPIGGEPTFDGYLRRLQREASEAFVEVLDGILKGSPLPRVAQTGTGRYFPPAGWSVRRRARRNFARALAGASAHNVRIQLPG
jgi:folate-dependent phosphoribosylglycinamide formyltransferase PurN